MLCRKHGTFRWLVLALEVIADLFHLDPLDAWLCAYVLDQSGNKDKHTDL